ncbi:MAG: isochorismatase family cysteine hydrolase, partial [Bacteroidota bacterium]
VGNAEKRAAVGRLITQTNALITYFSQSNLPIIKIQTVHKADKSTWNQWALEHDVPRLLEGSREAEYVPEVHSVAEEVWVTKTRVSAFKRTNLEALLHQLSCQRVVICGYSTNSCVGLTAIDAYEFDFQTVLAEEAILGTTHQEGRLMLDYLEKRFGIFPQSNQTIQTLIAS